MDTRPNFNSKTIWTADNLPVMRGMNSASVDLIYLDPPFNSKADYAAPIGSEAEGAVFKDTWSLSDINEIWLDLLEGKHPDLHKVIMAALTNSDKSYLIYMAVRLLEMRRILRRDGSIYLHCDPTMSHYLKLAMDAVFGRGAFKSEIIWKRTSSHSGAKRWGPIHDTLLFYAPGERYVWNEVHQPYEQNYLDDFYRHEDRRGRYRLIDLTGPGTTAGESGMPWRGIDPTEAGRHWALPKASLAAAYPDRDLSELSAQARLDLLDKAGLVHWPKSGRRIPQAKRYVDEAPGVLLQDICADIKPIGSQAKERTGYPTQKPLALLERIIKASSNEGDMVFDPFCGCATTLVAADRLQRGWAGIDVSEKAVELVMDRIKGDQGLFEDIVARVDIPRRSDLGKLPKYNCAENKRVLYGEQEGYCNGCRKHFEARHLEVDHMVAKVDGGTDHLDNLQLLCGNCNRVKGKRGQEYLVKRLNARPQYRYA